MANVVCVLRGERNMKVSFKDGLTAASLVLGAAVLTGCGGVEVKDQQPTVSVSTTPVAVGSAIPAKITNGDLWTLEGSSPNPLVNAQTLVFVPLQAQYTSPNGNGWRHEYKISKYYRTAMTSIQEVFQANVKVDMSVGGKTIIAQHHAGGLGTIMKVYVADSSESGFDDSSASNGIFDVYVRLRNTSGVEEKYALGTIRSGGNFDLKIVNNYGLVSVGAFGKSFEVRVENDSSSYLKFGSYQQSQDPDGNSKCGTKGNSSSFAACYARLGITQSKVTMTNVNYTRKTR